MYRHLSDEIIMVRPAGFYANPNTAADNLYQKSSDESLESIQEKAVAEFDLLVEKLKDKGVKVNVINDVKEPTTPDCVFPNNWFSSHEDGTLVLYPMFAPQRRDESIKFLEQVKEIMKNKQPDRELKILDYRHYVDENKFLEGTGAMVIDRKSKVAYCCLSARADKEVFLKFCEDTNHKPVYFHAQQDGIPVYHTNVIMGIGEKLAIISLDSIVDENERKMVEQSLKESGNEILDISLDQVKEFLGNTMELQGKDRAVLAMSKVAYESLSDEQLKIIDKHADIVYSDTPTLEFYGGGSVRCTIAEVF